jgi:hypothetical protein
MRRRALGPATLGLGRGRPRPCRLHSPAAAGARISVSAFSSTSFRFFSSRSQADESRVRATGSGTTSHRPSASSPRAQRRATVGRTTSWGEKRCSGRPVDRRSSPGSEATARVTRLSKVPGGASPPRPFPGRAGAALPRPGRAPITRARRLVVVGREDRPHVLVPVGQVDVEGVCLRAPRVRRVPVAPVRGSRRVVGHVPLGLHLLGRLFEQAVQPLAARAQLHPAGLELHVGPGVPLRQAHPARGRRHLAHGLPDPQIVEDVHAGRGDGVGGEGLARGHGAPVQEEDPGAGAGQERGQRRPGTAGADGGCAADRRGGRFI